jgi:transcriptional regulator
MPAERLSMRRIREVLRLRHQGLTERVIARMLGVSMAWSMAKCDERGWRG